MQSFRTVVILSVLISSLLLLSLIVYALYVFYRRYRTHGKTVRIRFVSDRTRSSDVLTPSSVSQTPLIHICKFFLSFFFIVLAYEHISILYSGFIVTVSCTCLCPLFWHHGYQHLWEVHLYIFKQRKKWSLTIVSWTRKITINIECSHF